MGKLLFFILCAFPTLAAASNTSELDFFESKIRPVLSGHCYGCHSEEAFTKQQLKGGLRLDRRETTFHGGDSGAVIVPGKPNDSLLLRALRYDQLEMPPTGALSEQIVNDFERWIRAGAHWPDDRMETTVNDPNLQDYEYWRQAHWAWRPIEAQRSPDVAHDDWSINAIDRFVLARLKTAGLSPSPAASRAVLYRRIHYGLLGLPPSYDLTQRFIKDQRPNAYQRAVDRLLASPAYGEKWGRHWLDVARYADNGGFNSQTKELYTNFPYAYTYRDYVVRSLNADLPYDRFVLEQIAADKLQLGEDNRALAALGFLTLGDKSFGTSSEDRIDDCIDTVTRGVMGITVSCARCHDHKYDPVSTEDYYSLFSVFRNSTIDIASRLHTFEKSSGLPLLFSTRKQRLAFKAKVARTSQQLEEAKQRFFAEASRHLRQRIADYLLAAVGRADDNRTKTLSDKVIKRWQKYLKQDLVNQRSAFIAWRAYVKLNADASPKTFSNTLDELANVTDFSTSVVMRELQRSQPQSLEGVAEAYGRVLRHVDEEKLQPGEIGVKELAEVLTAKESPIGLSQEDALKLSIHGGVDQLANLRKERDGVRFRQPRAVSLTDKDSLSEGRVFTRGNPETPGQVVQRKFLELLSPNREVFQDGSGRLELARAIIDSSNPLTARVIVNRIWKHHFGVGLVESSSDFGVRSDPPSHPELLDYLAARLTENGWSLKRIHRRILLSQTYRQSSFDRPELVKVDEENRLLWRMNRQRLSFESLRDSLLTASGELNRSIGGPAQPTWESRRRTIYGYINRYRIAPGYMTFDFPSTMRTSSQRSRTLVPQQSLFLMNAPFVQQRATTLIELPEVASQNNESSRVVTIYRTILGRNPEPVELRSAIQYVGSCQQPQSGDTIDQQFVWQRLAHALFLSNEFIYVD